MIKKALQNKYLPALIVSLFFSFIAMGQAPTTGVYQEPNNNGSIFKIIGGKYGVRIPDDTTRGRLAGDSLKAWIAAINDVIYIWSPSQQKFIASGGSPAVYGNGFGLNLSGYNFSVDTANIATKWFTDNSYYTKNQINSFFGGSTPISGYNKTNWDNVYAAYSTSLTNGGWAYQNALVDTAANLRASIGIGTTTFQQSLINGSVLTQNNTLSGAYVFNFGTSGSRLNGFNAYSAGNMNLNASNINTLQAGSLAYVTAPNTIIEGSASLTLSGLQHSNLSTLVQVVIDSTTGQAYHIPISSASGTSIDSLSFSSDVLTLYPHGLSNLTANIPTFFNSDVRFDDATRNIWMNGRTLNLSDSSGDNYWKWIYNPTTGLKIDGYFTNAAYDKDAEITIQPSKVELFATDYNLDRGTGLELNDSSIIAGTGFSDETDQTFYFVTPRIKAKSFVGNSTRFITSDAQGYLHATDSFQLSNIRPLVFDGTIFGTNTGYVKIGIDGGVYEDIVSINPYTSNKNEFSTSAFGTVIRTTYGSDTALIQTSADSTFSQIRLKAKYIDFEELLTDNTALQVLAKDASGHSVWRDVSSISGGGGSVSLTQYYVGVGDASNAVSGSSNLQFNSSNELIVGGTDNGAYKLQTNGAMYSGGMIEINAHNNDFPAGFNAGIQINGLYSPAMWFKSDVLGKGVLYTVNYDTQTEFDMMFTNGSSVANTVMKWFYDGSVSLPKYVSGTIPTGTAAYTLAVDASGNVIGASGFVTASGINTFTNTNTFQGVTALTGPVYYDMTSPALTTSGSVTAGKTIVFLNSASAGNTVTLNSPGSGGFHYIYNVNTADWSIASSFGVVKDAAGTTVSTILAGKVYLALGDGANWIITQLN